VSAEAFQWSLGTRIGFRFACVYFVLYSLPFPLGWIPGIVSGYGKLRHAVTPWVAIHVLHLSGPVTIYRPTGSGDTTLDFVENFTMVSIAALGATLWSVLDRNRREYRPLFGWLRVFVRYKLAFVLLGYGFDKIFPAQMPYPTLSRLIEPFGDFSPMGVLWSFMGVSPAYEIFAGLAEVTGAAFLLLRRTATLGALVSGGVLLNVVMLNFCYDVPVKLFSLNLLLMAVFLAAQDARNLVNFLVLNRAAAPANVPGPVFKKRWMKIGALVCQVLLIGVVLVQAIQANYIFYQRSIGRPDRPALYGLYEVESFTRNGQDAPPLTTDATRWRRVLMDLPRRIEIKRMDDSSQVFGAEYDNAGTSITVFPSADHDRKYFLACSHPDRDHMVIKGTLLEDSLDVKLRKVDTSGFPLVNRGFHWISESPFNR
jgi:hypothetical protein